MDNKKYIGVVENRKDPLKLGRCQVRIIGLMTDNKTELPTNDLPWATPIQSINSAGISGIGWSPTGLVEGSWVVIEFIDENQQYPLMVGVISGIPGLTTNISDVELFDDSDEQFVEYQQQAVVQTGSGGNLVDSSGNPVTSESEETIIGPLNAADISNLKEAIAKLESQGSGGYKAINSLGYVGKYQFGSPALQDLGYVVKGTSNASRVLVNNSTWTGKDGIISRNRFLETPDIQEKCMDLYMASAYKRMLSRGFVTTDTPKEKVAGLLAVNHLKGMGKGGVASYLQGDDSPDAYGSTPSKYYKAGYESIINKETSEHPTLDNIDKPAVDKDSQITDGNKKFDVPPEKTNKTPPTQGFTDPNGKYPIKSHTKESDLSRLARNSKIKSTIVQDKESSRTKGIDIANSGVTWEQSPVPYAAKYPFNHTFTSESGHVLEFDDTPKAERVHIYHKSGSFTEIDSMGNSTEIVVGSKTIIIDDDGLLHIKGSGHINVSGDLSIKVDRECHIEVLGDANIKVEGSLYQQVSGDYNIKAGGNVNIDGSNIFLNSGAASGVQSFNPEITKITAPTREEEYDTLTEDSETVKPDPMAAPVQKVEEDMTEPLKVIETNTHCDFSEVSYDMQLTTNYTLRQLCQGMPTFHPFPFKTGQHGLSDKELACNLKHLSINVVEPLREKYLKLGFVFTNTFREAGNGISKSKRISQHELGMAGDFQFTSFNRNRKKYFDLANEIKNLVPFDQLLLEYRDSGSVWIHISYNTKGNRKQILTLNNDKTVGSGLILLA